MFTHVIEERLGVRFERFRKLDCNIISYHIISAHRLRQCCTNTRRLVARPTIYFYGVFCYFYNNYCMSFNIKILVGSHRRSRNRKMTVRFTVTPEVWVFSMDLAACHLFVALNLEVAYRFVESWWILGLHVPGCSTSVKISEDIFIISLAALYCALGRWQGIEVLYSLLHYTKSAEKPTLEMGSKLQPTRCNVFFIYLFLQTLYGYIYICVYIYIYIYIYIFMDPCIVAI